MTSQQTDTITIPLELFEEVKRMSTTGAPISKLLDAVQSMVEGVTLIDEPEPEDAHLGYLLDDANRLNKRLTRERDVLRAGLAMLKWKYSTKNVGWTGTDTLTEIAPTLHADIELILEGVIDGRAYLTYDGKFEDVSHGG